MYNYLLIGIVLILSWPVLDLIYKEEYDYNKKSFKTIFMEREIVINSSKFCMKELLVPRSNNEYNLLKWKEYIDDINKLYFAEGIFCIGINEKKKYTVEDSGEIRIKCNLNISTGNIKSHSVYNKYMLENSSNYPFSFIVYNDKDKMCRKKTFSNYKKKYDFYEDIHEVLYTLEDDMKCNETKILMEVKESIRINYIKEREVDNIFENYIIGAKKKLNEYKVKNTNKGFIVIDGIEINKLKESSLRKFNDF